MSELLTSSGALSMDSELKIPEGPVDAAEFLNARFPDEASLSAGLEPLSDQLRDALAAIDYTLAEKLRADRNASAASAARVAASLAAVDALAPRLESLTAAARAAEAAARAAIAPAKPFSVALANNADTAAALDALVVLHDSVLSLEAAAGVGSLDAVAKDEALFPGIRAALATLSESDGQGGVGGEDESDGRSSVTSGRSGMGLQRLPELRARAKIGSESLRQTILSEFRQLSDVVTLSVTADASPSAKLDEAVRRLRVACKVAASMGGNVQNEVVGAHVRSRMLAFRAAFEMDKSGMLGTDKRFAWIRRELRSNWASLGGESMDRGWGVIFPDSWDVAWRLATAGMRTMRSWVCETLDAGADTDVVAMVGALGKAKEFEKELDRRFARAGEESEEALPGVKSPDLSTRAPFAGTLSSCFGPYMSAYVDQEDEHLRITIVELLRSETWKAMSDGGVLKSSTDLFLAIKKSMRMCAALDSRQSLFSLYKVFRKHLSVYAAELNRRLPAPVPHATHELGPLATIDAEAAAKESSFSMEQPGFQKRIDMACALIGTADYCTKTVEQLEESLRDAVEDAYAQEVTMVSERDKFTTTAAKAVRALVNVVCGDLRGSLAVISRTEWAEWSAVGDSSAYVEEISSKMSRLMPVLGSRLSKPHMRFFLERFASELLPAFSKHLYSCGRMNHTAAQQLLLDATSMKTLLLRVPSLAGAPVPGTFQKYVARESGKIEAMLKVVQSPTEMAVSAYTALVPNGTATDLQRILEIKGLLRAESAPLVLEYSRLVGPQQGLKLTPSSTPTSAEKANPSAVDEGVGGPGRPLRNSSPESAMLSSQKTAEAGVESVRALFRGFGSSWGTQLHTSGGGVADRLGLTAGRISESLESTTELMKKRFAGPGSPGS